MLSDPFPPTLFPSFLPPLSPSGPVHSRTTSPSSPPPSSPLFWLPEKSDLGTPLIKVLFSVLQTSRRSRALSRPQRPRDTKRGSIVLGGKRSEVQGGCRGAVDLTSAISRKMAENNSLDLNFEHMKIQSAPAELPK